MSLLNQIRGLSRWAAAAIGLASSMAFAQGVGADATPAATSGPLRLQQPATNKPTASDERKLGGDEEGRQRLGGSARKGLGTQDERDEPPLSEFEAYVTQLASAGRASPRPELPALLVRRFGAEQLWADAQKQSTPESAQVHDDYIVGPGDELLLDIWGGVEASLRLTVSRNGAVSIPRVGAVQIAGSRFADLPRVIRQRVGQSFKNFELAVNLGALRPVRVFITGFVAKPGVHTVPGLSNLAQAVATAGGPSPIGSYRQVQLRRGGQLVDTVDLYDLMLKGQAGSDRRLQSGDVIHVPAVGPQVGVIGSVNNPAVFEMKSGETVDDVLRMAGGLGPVANREQAVVLALGNVMPVRSIALRDEGKSVLRAGEVLRVLSLTDLNRPTASLQKRVRVDGEVQRPGDYLLPPGATLADAVNAAGGLSRDGYVFGTELRRESVRLKQVEGYDRALRELETEFTRSAVTRKERVAPPSEDEPKQLPGLRLIERLRQVQPTGRVVLEMAPDARQLPALALEDGDRITVPGRGQPVAVYGSVFNGGSYQFNGSRTLGDYLASAGGLTRGADVQGVFVIRADGSVMSNRQSGSGWWSGRDGLNRVPALPGDTLFVPEELDKVRWTQELKDWAQILSQFGLGAVALKNLTQ